MKKSFFAPNRIVFENPPEVTRHPDAGHDAVRSAPEKSDAQKVSEAAIIYKSNYRNLVSQVDKYAESDNQRIAEIAKKYRDTLNSNLIDPTTVDALLPAAQQENIKRISSVITEFSRDVRRAAIEGSRAGKDEEKARGGNAPEWLTRAVTLPEAYKRYQLVLKANIGTIRDWVKNLEKRDYPTTDDKDAAVSHLSEFAAFLNKQYGGLTEDMFADTAGVDRIIGAINKYFDENVSPYYNGLVEKHGERMAQRSKEKQNKTV